MSIHLAMRTSFISSRSVLCLFLVMASLSCTSKQEDAPKPPPQASTALPSVPGMLELPEGSPTLAHLQTERVALRPIRTTLKAQAGKI